MTKLEIDITTRILVGFNKTADHTFTFEKVTQMHEIRVLSEGSHSSLYLLKPINELSFKYFNHTD